jgi:predicted TIM-barrel fold metal-dependent hydrolase
MAFMLAVDTHQHLWSEELWSALSKRREAPFVRRSGDAWTLHLAAEPACAMPGPDNLSARLQLLDDDGVDRAIVAPSTALGLEWLPHDDADALIEAQREGALAAGGRFGFWGSVALNGSSSDDLVAAVDRELDAGAVGICLTSGALTGARALERVAPVLERLEQRDAPLFVHPGPSPRDAAQCDEGRWGAEPWWWPAMTDYVASMQQSWLAWGSIGRDQHPKLRVLFAMLAGLAPLQAERLHSRGAPRVARRALADQFSWYDTSSYGELGRAAVAAAVGPERLVHGSDRPVVDLEVTGAGADAREHAWALLGPALGVAA